MSIKFFEDLFGIKKEPEKMERMSIFWKQVDCATFISDLSKLEGIIKSPEAKRNGCTMSTAFGAGIFPAFTNKMVFVYVNEKTKNDITNAIKVGKLQGVSSFEQAV